MGLFGFLKRTLTISRRNKTKRVQSIQQTVALLGEEDILTALRWHLRRGRALVSVGGTVLAPRSYAVYFATDDYRHWVDTLHRKNQLISYLRKQLAHEMSTRGWSAHGPISVPDITISLRLDAQMENGSTDVRSSVESAAEFPDISPNTERENRAAQVRENGSA